jgi:hypothetical protein
VTPLSVAKNLRCFTLSMLLASGLSACGGSSNYGDDTIVDTPDSTPSVITTGTDITDALFTARDGSCDSYVGSYYSSVDDIQRRVAFSGEVEISSSASNCTIQSNAIPNHDFNDASARFATDVSVQNKSFDIPKSPSMSSTNTPIDLSTTNVVFLNGAIADVIAAACYGVGNEPLGQEKIGCNETQLNNPWRYDPMSPLNTFGTDEHNAHVQPDGTYHYHGNPVAMFDQDCDISGNPSPVIGFAADGFPVYGSCFTDPVTNSVRKAQTSFELKNNGGPRQNVNGYATPVSGQGTVASANYDGQFIGDYNYVEGAGDLDECNGMTVDGQYGYYITNSYPWIMSCFKGEVQGSFKKTGMAFTNRMHMHADGTYSSQ